MDTTNTDNLLRTCPCELCGYEISLSKDGHWLTQQGTTWFVCDSCYSYHNYCYHDLEA